MRRLTLNELLARKLHPLNLTQVGLAVSNESGAHRKEREEWRITSVRR